MRKITKEPRKVKGRDIIFLTNGGIGDQVAFKPVVAYVMENYLKDDTISVVSDYDWIWKDLVHYTYTTKKPCPAMETSVIVEIYPINKPSVVDYQASHSTTFASINMIRRELPLKYRQPHITLKEKHFEKLKGLPFDNLFVFHPGTTWTSRTLPPEVWQGWIDTVKDMGYKTAIIGKNMTLAAHDDKFNMLKGAWELNADYNFIDKLDPLETCALLSKSFALVTNDSGPLHMAGCFNNYIFAFCSTRLPEYIFTWRGPEYSQYWKACHLEKDELFYGIYDFDPFIQTGTDTAIGNEKELERVTPSREEFREKVLKLIQVGTGTDIL